MEPKHYTTRIFIGLFIITMLLTYIALALTTQYNQKVLQNTISNLLGTPKQKVITSKPIELLDTKDWAIYTDKTYPISFSYPKGWTVQSTPETKEGFYDITIKPADKTPNFHISISKSSFLGPDGLKQDPYKLGLVDGVSVNSNLIGLKKGEYYYTFDSSLNSEKIAEFTTL